MVWNSLKSANSDEFVNVFPINFLKGSLTKKQLLKMQCFDWRLCLVTWLLRSHNIHLSLNGRWISVTEKSNPSVTESSLILNYNELQLVKPCFISTNASTSEAKTQAQTIARHVIKTKAPITVHLASFWKWGFLELRSGLFATKLKEPGPS